MNKKAQIFCFLQFTIHVSRVLTSVYEAATHNAQEKCKTKNLDFLPLWFLYSIVAMNGLLVGLYIVICHLLIICYYQVVNAASNFWIYFSFGLPFRVAFTKKLKRICDSVQQPSQTRYVLIFFKPKISHASLLQKTHLDKNILGRENRRTQGYR